MENRKIFKTMIMFGGAVYTMDTIEHEGGFWLVPDWILSRDDKYIRPIRIIALKTIRHDDMGEKQNPRFVVNLPVPESVFRGVIPAGEEALFEVHENPQIVFPNPQASH